MWIKIMQKRRLTDSEFATMIATCEATQLDKLVKLLHIQVKETRTELGRASVLKFKSASGSDEEKYFDQKHEYWQIMLAFVIRDWRLAQRELMKRDFRDIPF